MGSKGVACFNGNCAHSVDDFEGNRFPIVYFTLGCHGKMKDEDRSKLQAMGYPTPAVDEDPFNIIRPPHAKKGRKNYVPTTEKHKSLPGHRYWLKKKLASRDSGKSKQMEHQLVWT